MNTYDSPVAAMPARSASANGFLLALVSANLVISTIRPQDFHPAFADMPIVPVSLGLCLLVWAFHRKNQAGPIGFLVLMFLFVSSFSRAANGWIGGGIEWFMSFLPIYLVFCFVTAVSADTRSVRSLMRILALSGAALVVHSLQQHYSGFGWTGEIAIQGRVRYIGILNDPNDLGLYLVMMMPFVLHFLRNAGGILSKTFWLVVLAGYLFNMYLTQSRGTMLAAFCILMILVYRRFGKTLSIGMGLAGIAAVQFLPERVAVISASESSASGRVEAWYSGLQMFESNPLFGVGAGLFTDYHYLTAHNSLLLVIAELGIVGTFVFVAMCGYGLLMPFRASKFLKDAGTSTEIELDRSVANALWLSLLGFCFAGFFLSRSYVVFLFILIGMINGHFNYLRQEFPLLRPFRLGADLFQWGSMTVACVIGLYVVVKVLL